MLLFIVLLILIVLFAFRKLKLVRIFKLKSLILPICCIAFIALLMIFSKTALSSAINGLNLWLEVVFPSVFPFLVASHILIKSGAARFFGSFLEPMMRPIFNLPGSASLALAIGVTCGYPVGAKTVAELRNDGHLTQDEGNRLLAFSNNAGPLFIIAAIGTGLYGSPNIGFILLACHIAASLTIGFILSFRRKRQQKAPKLSYKQRFRQSIRSNKAPCGFSELLGNAILDSVNTGLLIGGFIILFSVIIGILNDTRIITPISSFVASLTGNDADGRLAAGIVSGVIEITSGTYLISAVQSISLPFKLAATSFVIGWAGLSVHSQVKSVISKSDLSMKIYLWGKLLQGLIAAVYSYIAVSLASPAVTCTAYQSAFEFLRKNFEDSLVNFMGSTEWLAYAFMFLLSAGLLFTFVNQAKNRHKT